MNEIGLFQNLQCSTLDLMDTLRSTWLLTVWCGL